MRLRKQFRVWDKYKNEMLYDGFVMRHGNPPSIDWYNKQNEFNERHGFDIMKRPEYSHDHAEPLEYPETVEQNDAITEIMEPGCLSGASWSLIDWSNFYFDNYVEMQFTGMHDKHGQMIWELDLLECNGIVSLVTWHYCNFIWNGQQITDFRKFDDYGNQIEFTAETALINGMDATIACGYQGDEFGLPTKTLIKIGDLFEDGAKYGFNWKDYFEPVEY